MTLRLQNQNALSCGPPLALGLPIIRALIQSNNRRPRQLMVISDVIPWVRQSIHQLTSFQCACHLRGIFLFFAAVSTLPANVEIGRNFLSTLTARLVLDDLIGMPTFGTFSILNLPTKIVPAFAL